jgi:molybdopterin-guanine dinucleotide biosynthesis protein B
LAALLRRLSPVDLVVVEGFKAQGHPKIEVYRAVNAKPFLFRDAPNVRAIAADCAVPEAPVPVVPLDDISAVAEQALRIALPLGEVVAELEASPPGQRLSMRRAGEQP